LVIVVRVKVKKYNNNDSASSLYLIVMWWWFSTVDILVTPFFCLRKYCRSNCVFQLTPSTCITMLSAPGTNYSFVLP
jgi:hypothetical protein